MNQVVAGAFNISALPDVTELGRLRPTDPSSEANSTLDILPLKSRHGPDLINWVRARQRLGQFANPQLAGDRLNGISIDAHTVAFAAQTLAGLQRQGIPAPTINPSADGAVYAEWHTAGIDAELIFEGPYKVVLLIEDARGEVPSVECEASDLSEAMEALRALSAR